MKAQTLKRIGSAVIGSIAFVVGVVLLSINTDNNSFLTTCNIVLPGITALVVGMIFLIEYVKMAFLPDIVEIDLMDDEEIMQMLEEIEALEPLYFRQSPRMRMLYEDLGEKIIEKYNKEIKDKVYR